MKIFFSFWILFFLIQINCYDFEKFKYKNNKNLYHLSVFLIPIMSYFYQKKSNKNKLNKAFKDSKKACDNEKLNQNVNNLVPEGFQSIQNYKDAENKSKEILKKRIEDFKKTIDNEKVKIKQYAEEIFNANEILKEIDDKVFKDKFLEKENPPDSKKIKKLRENLKNIFIEQHKEYLNLLIKFDKSIEGFFMKYLLNLQIKFNKLSSLRHDELNLIKIEKLNEFVVNDKTIDNFNSIINDDLKFVKDKLNLINFLYSLSLIKKNIDKYKESEITKYFKNLEKFNNIVKKFELNKQGVFNEIDKKFTEEKLDILDVIILQHLYLMIAVEEQKINHLKYEDNLEDWKKKFQEIVDQG